MNNQRSAVMAFTLPTILALIWGSVFAAEKQMIVPETSTTLGFVFVGEGQIAIYDPDLQTFVVDSSLAVPGNPPLNAIHKLSNPGQFLFVTRDGQALNNDPQDPLAVILGVSVYPQDITRFDGETGYSRFFCNDQLSVNAIDAGSSIDAMYLDGGDGGDLIISLDAADDIGGFFYEQNDLLRYTRTGPGCGDWQLVGCEFDASTLDGASNPLIPSETNVVGVTKSGDEIFFALDVPSFLGASTYNDYEPDNGELATWNVVSESFTLNATITGFATATTNTYPNSVAAPPASCTGLGSPNINDSIVDLCGADWFNDSGVKRFRIEWLPQGGVLQYKVHRGERSDFCPAGLDLSVLATTINNFYVDSDPQAPGVGYYYLINADDGPFECGMSGCPGSCCTRNVAPGICP